MRALINPTSPELLTEEENHEYRSRARKLLGGVALGVVGIGVVFVSIVTSSVTQEALGFGITAAGFIMMDRQADRMMTMDSETRHRPQADQLPLES